MATTTLKLPDDIKQLAAEVARQQGQTPHAFMVDAIRDAALAAQQRARFVSEALEALDDMDASGQGFEADEVHAYLMDRAQGRPVARPAAKAWRK